MWMTSRHSTEGPQLPACVSMFFRFLSPSFFCFLTFVHVTRPLVRFFLLNWRRPLRQRLLAGSLQLHSGDRTPCMHLDLVRTAPRGRSGHVQFYAEALTTPRELSAARACEDTVRDVMRSWGLCRIGVVCSRCRRRASQLRQSCGRSVLTTSTRASQTMITSSLL